MIIVTSHIHQQMSKSNIGNLLCKASIRLSDLCLPRSRDLTARLILYIFHLLSLDPIPLLLILDFIRLVRRQLGSLLIFDLLRQDEVENDSDEGNDGEAGLQDELDGVVEAEKGAIRALVGEDVGEPASNVISM